jgi:3-hydroxyisobutyrate dehydrogenase-like beta-hydroxyacid dehydrogenase
MATTTVCVLHPGEMGAEVGAAARAGGARVLWVSAGRGGATRHRAGAAGLEDAGTLQAALDESAIALSVCPPHAAVDLASSVAAAGFRGIYVDANAISPDTSRRIGSIVETAGATFVDGGIVGPPPTKPGTTRLYLSGSKSAAVAALFAGSPLGAVVLDAPVGAASALKACYAGWTKGAATLLLSVRALARREGVEAALAEEWKISQPNLFAQVDRAVLQSRKGWRWIAEMEEIGATFDRAGLPDGYALAAAEVCRRLEAFKDARGLTIEDVVGALLAPAQQRRVR